MKTKYTSRWFEDLGDRMTTTRGKMNAYRTAKDKLKAYNSDYLSDLKRIDRKLLNTLFI